MFDKKKLNFWRLALFYTGATIVILFFLWSSPYKPNAQMMESSMGNMMKTMHLSNITIYDLMGNPRAEQSTSETESHHNDDSSPIYNMSIITTSIIFLVLPLIIGGTIILTIVWIK
jgi:hypothetical protein